MNIENLQKLLKIMKNKCNPLYRNYNTEYNRIINNIKSKEFKLEKQNGIFFDNNN